MTFHRKIDSQNLQRGSTDRIALEHCPDVLNRTDGSFVVIDAPATLEAIPSLPVNTWCGPQAVASMRLHYLLLPWFAFAASLHATVTIDYVLVGDAGNVADSTGFGAVGYSYQISKYEVTNAQYAEFLNAKAATDPNALYSANMGISGRGGITQSGVSGSFTYSVKTDMGDKPVNSVTHLNAQRFSNWLHNGQGTGDTETGAYTTVGNLISHDISATVWIPTENEWYKAAYYQPVGAGGDVDGYWLYPTRSNSIPTQATANGIGGISNPGTNVANYDFGADWNALDGNVTTVGSAGAGSASYYGTYDQGGNVWEWNDAVIASNRGLRGGSWFNTEGNMLASLRFEYDPVVEFSNVGFRLAISVPEPSRMVLLLVGGCSLLMRRRRVPFVH